MVRHKAWVTNWVADALSWRNNLLIAMQLEVLSFDSFRDLLDTDPYFSPILTTVCMGERYDFLCMRGFCLRATNCVFQTIV